MPDVEIRLENEGVHGLVALGTYLSDAVKRFGFRFEKNCDYANNVHFCRLVVSSGIDSLSDLTTTESEHFEESGRRPNERLACESQIIRPGEIVIMTDPQKKEEEKKTEAPKAKFQKEFDDLPLDQKIANLVRMEAVTLSETVSYVMNSPMKVVEKVGDIMSEFGMRLEAEAKKATRPAEAASKSAEPKPRPAKTKSKAEEPKAEGGASPEPPKAED